jgi:hypothetical protein
VGNTEAAEYDDSDDDYDDYWYILFCAAVLERRRHRSDNMEMLSGGKRLAVLFGAEIKGTDVASNRGLTWRGSL